ncbi:hypothetical protein [Thermospira aquatica]|nr:hypothetical protein [Thermospira aquatica]
MNQLYAYLRLYTNFFSGYENDREKRIGSKVQRSMMILKLPTSGF